MNKTKYGVQLLLLGKQQVPSTKNLMESEAPRRSWDFSPFRVCLLACLLLACLPNLLGLAYTLKRVIKPRLVPPAW